MENNPGARHKISSFEWSPREAVRHRREAQRRPGWQARHQCFRSSHRMVVFIRMLSPRPVAEQPLDT